MPREVAANFVETAALRKLYGAREVAETMLEKVGCTQAAMESWRDQEASDAVWLLAALVAYLHDYDDTWWAFHRPGWTVKQPSEFRVSDAEAVLGMWLRWARKRIGDLERRSYYARAREAHVHVDRVEVERRARAGHLRSLYTSRLAQLAMEPNRARVARALMG